MYIRLPATMAVVGALVLAGCGSSSSSSTSTTNPATTSTASASSASQASHTQVGFEGVPIEQGAPLGSAGTTQTGTVDGIKCGPTEQLAYHIHAHLQVYDNGQPRSLPGGIGIPGSQMVNEGQGPVAAGGKCILLAAHARSGRDHPHRVADRADLHARELLRRVAPAAQRQPGRRRQGQGHRVRQRQAVDEGPALDPAQRRTR